MQEFILNDLLSNQPIDSEQKPLASIRHLAKHYKVSPLTIHRVLKKMVKKGLVFSIPRKGFYWGKETTQSPLPTPRTKEHTINLILRDLHNGFFNPFQTLPSTKELSQYYKVNPKTILRSLSALTSLGYLFKKGIHYQPARSIKNIDKSKTTLLLISRCDSKGSLILESDREVQFIKSVYQEAIDHHLSIEVVGYEDHISKGIFYSRHGKQISIEPNSKIILGAMISTWLIRDPISLAHKMAKKGINCSFLWEYAHIKIPKFRHKNSTTACFNLAFGEMPGRIVAEHLLAHNYNNITFLSPFHSSDWSKQRLSGIKNQYRNNSDLEVFELTDNANASAWDFHCKYKSTSESRFQIKIIIKRLLESISIDTMDAIVCVNDLIAEILLEVLNEQNIQKSPYIISFDNSDSSYRLRFDSFAFHTEGLVRQMLYHLTHPSSKIFSTTKLHEIMGSIMFK